LIILETIYSINLNAHTGTLFNLRYLMVPNLLPLSSTHFAGCIVDIVTSQPVLLVYDGFGVQLRSNIWVNVFTSYERHSCQTKGPFWSDKDGT
jgi:hypothetical protein